jgi:hypothetical protein
MLKLLFIVGIALLLDTSNAAPVLCSPGYQDASCASPLSAPPQTAPTCSTDAGWQTITAAIWIGSQYSTPVCSYTAPPTCPSGSTQVTPATWNGTAWSGLVCQPKAQTCIAGQTWDGTACVPSTCLQEGGTWNSTTAVCNCPVMKTWSASHCQWTGYRLQYALYWTDYQGVTQNGWYSADVYMYNISSVPYNVSINQNPGTQIFGKWGSTGVGASGSKPRFRLPTGTLINMDAAASSAMSFTPDVGFFPLTFHEYPNHQAWSNNSWFTSRGCIADTSVNYHFFTPGIVIFDVPGVDFYSVGYTFTQWCPSTAAGSSGINAISVTGNLSGTY